MRHIKLFEDFSDALYVVELTTDESDRSRIYVFKDEADQEAMYDELLAKSPNLADARNDVAWDFIYEELPDYIDLDSLDDIDPDEIYDLLNKVDKERIEDRAIDLADSRGRKLGDARYSQDHRYYEVLMYIDSMDGMMERIAAMYKKGGEEEVERRFANMDWISPEELAREMAKIKRTSKTKNLFGL